MDDRDRRRIRKIEEDLRLRPLRPLDELEGSQGVQGAQGPQGPQGGVQGDQGDQGPQGDQGSQGAQGFQGTQGVQGAAGAQGNQGYQGEASTVPGPQGSQGTQGSTGSQGTQGVTGAQGDQGAQGSSPSSRYCDAYDNAGGQTLSSSAITINLDTIRSESAGDFTLASDEIAVVYAGTYTVIFRIAAESDTLSTFGDFQAWLELDSGGGFAEVDGSRVYMHNYYGVNMDYGTAGAGHAILELGADDKVRIRAQRGPPPSADMTTIADASGLSIFSVGGASGDQGPQGDQGAQGATGEAGPQGNQGVQGNQGAQGDTGAQGDQGAQGATGDTGAQGDQGSQGSTGSQGAQGAAGEAGSQGAQGATGAQGTQGDQGDQGTQGLQGSQGVQGTSGALAVRSAIAYIAGADVASTTLPKVLMRIPVAGTIAADGIKAKLGNNETCGATSLILDIHKILLANVDTDGQGTTIYTTQGNRPTIANTHKSTTATDPDVTAVAAGDCLAFYVDQVGTNVTAVEISVDITPT